MILPKKPKPTPREERQAYYDATVRDENRCVKCGFLGIERDHRKNRSQGGLTTVANLQGLCRECHQWKTENPAEALRLGFAVPSYARPEFWPGWRVGIGWVQYFDAPNVFGRWWQPITEHVASLLMQEGRAE